MWKHRRYVCGAAAVLAFVSSCSCNRGGGTSQASGASAAPAKHTSAEYSATISGTPAAATDQPRRLAGPSLDEWQPRFAATGGDKPSKSEYSHLAVVTEYEVPIYSRPGARWPIGLAAIGDRIPARPDSSSGCKDGQWYQVSGNGFLCSGDGVHVVARPVAQTPLDGGARARVARRERAVPFRIAKSVEGAPHELSRLPTAEELERLKNGERPSGLVRRTLDGVYFLALGGKVEVGGEEIWETVEGYYIRDADVEQKPEPTMIGELLEDGGLELPLAFAYRATDLLCLGEDEVTPCGEVELHARFPVHDVVERDGRTLVLVDDETAVDREVIRIVERTERPRGVGSKGKWIHIDLTEQALVAYEGDRPLYTTLVTTGRDGFHTPTGLNQVDRVYASKTMRGRDEDGPYEVQEVPWTLFFKGNYAVHGAYWHNSFGRTRSHGCVNVPPADARWIYHWAVEDMPFGWSAMFHRRGAHVYVTGKTPPDEPDA